MTVIMSNVTTTGISSPTTTITSSQLKTTTNIPTIMTTIKPVVSTEQTDSEESPDAANTDNYWMKLPNKPGGGSIIISPVMTQSVGDVSAISGAHPDFNSFQKAKTQRKRLSVLYHS